MLFFVFDNVFLACVWCLSFFLKKPYGINFCSLYILWFVFFVFVFGWFVDGFFLSFGLIEFIFFVFRFGFGGFHFPMMCCSDMRESEKYKIWILATKKKVSQFFWFIGIPVKSFFMFFLVRKLKTKKIQFSIKIFFKTFSHCL